MRSWKPPSAMAAKTVNARYYQNVRGRRTDVSDCQSLQYLHTVGLLRASFRPEQQVCVLRSFLRHRNNLIEIASTHVLHMQKALNQMRLQIHHVLSNITGQPGLAILDAILADERDPKVLALRDPRVKGQPGDDHQVAGGRPPARAPIYSSPILGRLSLLPKADCGL